jgi:hypothetical protein
MLATFNVEFGCRLFDAAQDASIEFAHFLRVASDLVRSAPERAAYHLALLIAVDVVAAGATPRGAVLGPPPSRS